MTSSTTLVVAAVVPYRMPISFGRSGLCETALGQGIAANFRFAKQDTGSFKHRWGRRKPGSVVSLRYPQPMVETPKPELAPAVRGDRRGDGPRRRRRAFTRGRLRQRILATLVHAQRQARSQGALARYDDRAAGLTGAGVKQAV